MTLRELADALIAANQTGETAALLDNHYAEDCVSVEAVPMGDNPPDVTGLDAIRGKHEWWEANNEVLESTVDGPYLHGDDRFAVIFTMKVKDKNDGSVSDFKEVAVYHAADGKICREEFFYTFG